MESSNTTTSTSSTLVEIPQYFICPISLQIMKDPVTTVTGITYDRLSIERWVFSDNNTNCPLTNQPLLPKHHHHYKNSDNANNHPDILTPNHTLRRLIQAWCTANAFDRIPTPRPPIDRLSAASLLFDLSNPSFQLKSLNRITTLVSESQSNRRTFIQLDAARFLLKTITSSSNDHVELALNLLLALRVPNEELKPLVVDNSALIEALTRVLLSETVRSSSAIMLLKTVTHFTNPNFLERLKVEFFVGIVGHIQQNPSKHVTKAALHVLLNCCPWGRNRTRIVEAGTVHELIELELNNNNDKRRSELVMEVLDCLCGCAEGRAQLVGHAAGIAVVAKRMMRVSPVVDEAAVGILSTVSRNSATEEVVMEMLRVGAVSKLCFVLQGDCSSPAREKARWVLKLHSAAWKNSECINVNLLTRYP